LPLELPDELPLDEPPSVPPLEVPASIVPLEEPLDVEAPDDPEDPPRPEDDPDDPARPDEDPFVEVESMAASGGGAMVVSPDPPQATAIANPAAKSMRPNFKVVDIVKPPIREPQLHSTRAMPRRAGERKRFAARN
jgi:hypothetical protein